MQPTIIVARGDDNCWWTHHLADGPTPNLFIPGGKLVLKTVEITAHLLPLLNYWNQICCTGKTVTPCSVSLVTLKSMLCYLANSAVCNVSRCLDFRTDFFVRSGSNDQNVRYFVVARLWTVLNKIWWTYENKNTPRTSKMNVLFPKRDRLAKDWTGLSRRY